MKTTFRILITPVMFFGMMTAINGCVVRDRGQGQGQPNVAVGGEIDVVDVQGYHHRGQYDDHHDWHGGYYDHDNHFHNDPHDWHR